jgi:long-chain acyl-CoA synthetase
LLIGDGGSKVSRSIFITGANGFLGTQIARRIINQTEHKIIALVRAENDEIALKRLNRAWWDWPELTDAVGQRVQVLRGDVTKADLGLGKSDYQNINSSITHIIHTAADLRLQAPLEELRKINLQGTKNVLDLAQALHKNQLLARYSHVSTAYVAGKQQGSIPESSFTDDYGFLTNYEKSKFESELKVREYDIPFSIFRPSMVVGDSQTGEIKTFNTIYILLRLYLTGKLSIIPVKPSLKINLIPVDHVADAITRLTLDPFAAGRTFHLTAPYKSLPTIKELLEFVRNWAHENLGITLPSPIFIPLSSLIQRFSNYFGILREKKRGIIKILFTLAPYLNEDRIFLRGNTDRLLGPYNLRWQNYLPVLLNYAVYMGFLHRSERTVHEQIFFRLKSRSRKVEYFDITKCKIKFKNASEIRQDMHIAAKSLKKLGVCPGDRVAIIGYNGIRYLTLDVAVGLIGAVSVPIYYTSPMEEINGIIKDSEAKILFIGIPDLLKQINQLKSDIKIVSFLHDSKVLPSEIISWNKFLSIGEKEEDHIFAPVDFDDLATIRYTSGTTGKPKGVMFNHGNLRWMAESLVSLIPWKDRNQEVTYLSFLPMNHVVEGILGTYSPHYAPAPLKIYFLEDFHELQRTLPLIRPKIFFSVPRYYEKVWSNIRENWLGKTYLKTNNDFEKNIIRKVLKREILRKTGLDRCIQLIVGSAAVSENLLKNFHDLGIEIHNAYGLTEAPLVTINRLGKNKIGTVGEPLPDTFIRISEEGEIMVQGPQITQGYYKQNSDFLFRYDWLLTGDKGYITPEGSLVITGRKKEVIINSYGKTIDPLKIEAMLRDIPEIADGMIVGEGKPYCIALLWIKNEDINPDSIYQSIINLNLQVSRPEQIKRWAILKYDLSIENGDLTPNLKLKRQKIIKRYKDLIYSIYENDNIPQEIIYKGSLGENNES